jgi:prolyl oligopeptidase
MTRNNRTYAIVVTIVAGALMQTPEAVRASDRGAPPTTGRDVLDTYFDVKVDDPYRWLENDDSAVKQWSAAQDARTRGYLDGLSVRKPSFDRLWRQIS